MIASIWMPGAAYASNGTESGTAQYTGNTEDTYTVTMVNGYNKTGQKSYREGDRITVQAKKGYGGMKFLQWTSIGGGTFDDPYRETTVFTMPAEDVTLVANMSISEVCRVIFDLNGGTLASELPDGWTQEGNLIKAWVEFGKMPWPPAIYRRGYTLKGWDKPLEEIKDDTTYKAVWTREGTGLSPDPDTSDPDTSKPDTEKPDTEKPDTEKPDTEKPDTEKPDTEKPDTEKPDTGYTWEKTNSGYSLKAPDGSYVSGWAKVDGKWYYCKDGIMQQGWLAIDSAWYYLTPSGAMAVGWQKVGNTWYYLTPSGAMAVGWQKVGNTWYYLTDSGAMKTGWLQQGSSWYYLTPSGAMAVGWNWIDGKCYYFYESGKMAANTKIGGYRLNKSGQWVR